jgi:hypothetical protein
MSVISRTIGQGFRVQLCSLLLTPWFRHRPDRTYRRARLIRALFGDRMLFGVSQHLALVSICGQRPGAAQIVLVNHDKGGEVTPIETDQAPPVVRALMRFTMAAGQRDRDQAYAVWLALPRGERITLTMGLVTVAAEHLQAHMGEAVASGPIEVPDDARDLTGGV